MAKITKHGGPSDAVTGVGLPRRQAAPSAADMLRARGKLGPYGEDSSAPPAVEPESGSPDTEEAGGPDLKPERPAGNASKAEWVSYARAVDPEAVLTDGADPESATRDELRDLYADG